MLIHYIVIRYPPQMVQMAFCDLSHTFHKQVTNVSQHIFVILLWGILISPLIPPSRVTSILTLHFRFLLPIHLHTVTPQFFQPNSGYTPIAGVEHQRDRKYGIPSASSCLVSLFSHHKADHLETGLAPAKSLEGFRLVRSHREPTEKCF